MTSCEKTWQFKSLLFDSVLIENQFFYYMQNLMLETKTNILMLNGSMKELNQFVKTII